MARLRAFLYWLWLPNVAQEYQDALDQADHDVLTLLNWWLPFLILLYILALAGASWGLTA